MPGDAVWTDVCGGFRIEGTLGLVESGAGKIEPCTQLISIGTVVAGGCLGFKKIGEAMMSGASSAEPVVANGRQVHNTGRTSF